MTASKMLNNCYFQCLVCNDDIMHDNEIAPIAFSTFGKIDICHDMHIHHAHTMNLFKANGDVQEKRCIMMDDVFLYHAHTFFLSYMMCVDPHVYLSTSMEHELTNRALESYLRMSSNGCFLPHTSATQDLSMRAHRHFAKVTSFYLGNHSMLPMNWLLFECCFAFLVSLIGYMKRGGTLMSCQTISLEIVRLPPLHDDDELSSRTTLFEGGGR